MEWRLDKLGNHCQINGTQWLEGSAATASAASTGSAAEASEFNNKVIELVEMTDK